MFRYVATILVGILLSAPLVAGITPFPASFHTQMVPTNGTSLYVRVGGKGPAVVLLHGFGDTGDMWAPLAIVLAKDHTVIVPDLRGMGMSDHPDTGYTKKNQAVDIAGVMDALKVQKADLVTHDIGNMVGYALAAQYPVRVTRWVVIDAPLPGIGDWDNITRSPMLWHFNFRGPDEERLVQGRERIYLDRFWNELSGDPKGIDEDTRQHYAALYARPHAMHDAFEQFGAFSQDAADNKRLLAKGGKITMPVFAIGAEKFFGKGMADEMRFAASNVTGGIVPNSGHWIMEENPQATIKLVTDFLAKQAWASDSLTRERGQVRWTAPSPKHRQRVGLPGLEREVAQVVDATHEATCAYSNAVLPYDPTRPASFPDNGRTLTDDAFDSFIRILTNGKVTEDKVEPHDDLLPEFPYVGPPHQSRVTKAPHKTTSSKN